MVRQSRYILASEIANCGSLVMSKTDGVSAEEIAKTIDFVNTTLGEFQCKRRFGDEVITKSWDEFEDHDFEGFMSTGYRLNDLVKEWFKQSDVYKSVYIMNKNMPLDRMNDIVKAIFDDKECGDVFRIKGFLRNGEVGWTEINATSKKTEVKPIEAGQEIIIIIGSDLVEKRIQSYFD